MLVARSKVMRTALCWVLTGLVTFGATGLVACVQPVGVHTASLPTAPFGRYRTFSFAAAEGAPEGYRLSPRSAEVQRQLKPLLIAELQQKGYTLATGKGDFVLAYGSGRRERVIRHSEPSHDWLDEDEENDFIEGSIVLDIFDGSNDGQVWHGATRAGIDPNSIDQAQLERSVRLLLEEYPSAPLVAPRQSAGAGALSGATSDSGASALSTMTR
jgi:hypothetical protein